ncbi:hypothetical protein LRS35_25370 [Klebsiella variicola]|uniref:hypothetical protein n=1 Tax=Klebsiella variicola TaxID=244366 RepID=UPI0022AF7F90|nr:hypothetical protein [Klebsiella variicola]MCZ3534448.1 hypothetical protein [Klebsiella variicola]HDY8930026.1 hypothetical protein [Klebsiella pneumoniae]
MEINGGVMTNTRVQVDGIMYRKVVFNNCIMVYNGSGGDMGFVECTFNNCSWHFSGPAGNTIAFIKDLVTFAGPDGHLFLKSLFGVDIK